MSINVHTTIKVEFDEDYGPKELMAIADEALGNLKEADIGYWLRIHSKYSALLKREAFK